MDFKHQCCLKCVDEYTLIKQKNTTKQSFIYWPERINMCPGLLDVRHTQSVKHWPTSPNSNMTLELVRMKSGSLQ